VSGSPGRVLFSAYPLGYGPAAKALVLAAECGSAGFGAVFAGRGVAYELVSRSDGVFEEIVDAEDDRTVRLLVRESAAVVSVMDRDVALLAARLGRPLHVVDSLLWMREQVPRAFRPARRYWAQEFVGVQERATALVPQASVVGPIVESTRVGRPTARRLVVSLGGHETPDDADSAYGELVLRALAAGGAPATFEEPATILASSSTARKIEPLSAKLGFDLRSLAHETAVERLAAAALVIAAPGLTTAFECFRAGAPVLFLPPQNASQWKILEILRAQGLAPHALDWADLREQNGGGAAAARPEGTEQVRAAIRELAGTRRAQDALTRGLAAGLAQDLPELAGRQREFFRSLGSNGAPVIASELAGELPA
jgi:hypothetical protein